MPTVPEPLGAVISAVAAIIMLGVLAVSLVLGLLDAARKQRGLEQGRRDYPCSHGAAGWHRWPDAPKRHRR